MVSVGRTAAEDPAISRGRVPPKPRPRTAVLSPPPLYPSYAPQREMPGQPPSATSLLELLEHPLLLRLVVHQEAEVS